MRSFKRAGRVWRWIVAVRTADPAGAVPLIQQWVNGKGEEAAVLAWDIMRGLQALNTAGKAEIDRVADGRDTATIGPADVLALAGQLHEDSLLLYGNAQRF